MHGGTRKSQHVPAPEIRLTLLLLSRNKGIESLYNSYVVFSSMSYHPVRISKKMRFMQKHRKHLACKKLIPAVGQIRSPKKSFGSEAR